MLITFFLGNENNTSRVQDQEVVVTESFIEKSFPVVIIMLITFFLGNENNTSRVQDQEVVVTESFIEKSFPVVIRILHVLLFASEFIFVITLEPHSVRELRSQSM